eukprot:Platyproteum_vivax@DN7013_c0_g1_i1.p1
MTPTPKKVSGPPPPSQLLNVPKKGGKAKGPPPPSKMGRAATDVFAPKLAPPSKTLGPPRKAGIQKSQTTRVGDAPFGKTIRWQGLEQIEGTVFQELSRSTTNLDASVLARVFAPKAAAAKPTVVKKASRAAMDDQVRLLREKRAYNMSISWARVKQSPTEMSQAMEDLNWKYFSEEILERLKDLMPNAEEAQQLRSYKEDITNLRSIEQKLIPFCRLQRVAERMRVLLCSLELPSIGRDFESQLDIVISACEEAKGSMKLKKVLSEVLRFGNFLNYGSDTNMIRGFSLGSLLKLLECKTTINAFSALDFIVANLHAINASLLELRKEMPSISQAAKFDTKGSLERMAKVELELKFLTAEASNSVYSAVAKQHLDLILAMGAQQSASMNVKFAAACAAVDVTAKFFGEKSDPKCFEAFFQTINTFLSEYEKTAAQIKRNPKRYQALIV